jgi:hypothetical protein
VIYEMSKDIAERLAVRKFPYPVQYGKRNAQTERYWGYIQFDRDPGASDDVGPVQGQGRVPAKKMLVRQLCGRVRVYARSNLDGAHEGDHERECEIVVDGVLTELDRWFVESRAAAHLNVVESRYLTAKELDDIEVWPGVVYQVRFKLPRGVTLRDYDGEGAQLGTIVHSGNRVEVRNNEDAPPEIILIGTQP